ncbi:hypothetical protein TNCV_906931 [Trichonephila clavipes]|nr:hypothetical protein TNCV_906931 [Trichonephila clavipes]
MDIFQSEPQSIEDTFRGSWQKVTLGTNLENLTARFEGHAFQMPTEQSGHSRLIISVSVKFQSTPRAFPTNPGMVGICYPDLLVLNFH